MLVGNTTEPSDLVSTVTLDLAFPVYPADFDHQRAQADLESILSACGVDAYPSLAPGAGTRQVIANSGYGSIMATQLPRAVELLNADPNTRRAAVTFWNGDGKPPCTLSAVYKVRDGRLHAVFFQRSTDADNVAYDLYNFAGIARWVRDRLTFPCELGTLALVTASLHTYV